MIWIYYKTNMFFYCCPDTIIQFHLQSFTIILEDFYNHFISKQF